MHTHHAVRERRSVKHYDPNHKMSQEEVDQLLELALLSPTSFNIQNWRFVVIKDPDVRAKLREAAWNQSQVTEASLLVVLCADLNAWDREPERYWQSAPNEVREKLVPMIRGFYKDNKELQRDEAMRSVGIAGQTLMLAAKAMGYDSGPMIGFDPNKVAEIINLPDDHVIGMLLVIGKAIQPARDRGGQLPKDEVVFVDKFPEN
jgi:nitroreductase